MKDGSVEYQGRLSEVKKVNPELYESWRIALKEAKVAEATRLEELVMSPMLSTRTSILKWTGSMVAKW